MAFAAKHSFTSAKEDGTDASLLKPSDWNANHVLTCATNVLLGRASAGAGNVEEIPTSAAVIALLASADLPALLAAMGIVMPTTGDAFLTLKNTAPSGWLMCDDQTFGSATSGAAHQSATYQALFTLLYNNVLDAWSPLYTSGAVPTTRAAQGSAATAWAANCQIRLTQTLGRAFVAAGSGSGLTARVLGSSFGEESHLLLTTEMPSHFHSASISDPGHTHGVGTIQNLIYNPGSTGGGLGGGGSFGIPIAPASAFSIIAAATGVRVNSSNGLDTTNNTGGGLTHNNTQASTAWNVMVKL